MMLSPRSSHASTVASVVARGAVVSEVVGALLEFARAAHRAAFDPADGPCKKPKEF
jgi:hypothetical protein